MTRLHPHQKTPERQQIEAAIAQAGRVGITRSALVKLTGLQPRRVGSILHNLERGRGGDTFTHVNLGKGRTLYLLREHKAAHPATPQRTPNLPGRGHSVLAITMAQPRNITLSPDRRRIEEALERATEPLTAEALSLASGAPLQKTRRVLQTLRHEGRAANVGTHTRSLWAVSSHKPAAPRPTPVCNSAMPTARPYQLPRMSCPRADADQHLAAPSRRADQLERYRAPVLIGSSLGGGV